VRPRGHSTPARRDAALTPMAAAARSARQSEGAHARLRSSRRPRASCGAASSRPSPAQLKRRSVAGHGLSLFPDARVAPPGGGRCDACVRVVEELVQTLAGDDVEGRLCGSWRSSTPSPFAEEARMRMALKVYLDTWFASPGRWRSGAAGTGRAAHAVARARARARPAATRPSRNGVACWPRSRSTGGSDAMGHHEGRLPPQRRGSARRLALGRARSLAGRPRRAAGHEAAPVALTCRGRPVQVGSGARSLSTPRR
jgi:hypothetical protein